MKDRGPVLQVLGPTGPEPSRTGTPPRSKDEVEYYLFQTFDVHRYPLIHQEKLNFRIQGSEIDLLCTAAFQGRKPDYFLAMEAQEVLMKLYTGTLLPLGGFLLKDEDVKKNSGRTKFLVRINRLLNLEWDLLNFIRSRTTFCRHCISRFL
ncbi:hypothetical protein RIR_jg24822.t1 [Rhizophagus irregularis DAOM 181602=DAOM 197198]|nr:hypothetical protein RIR_jg24822.t1 [Rhizophagus irregularis DAOM 181602=DAOM 197198]